MIQYDVCSSYIVLQYVLPIIIDYISVSILLDYIQIYGELHIYILAEQENPEETAGKEEEES
jgi:hypothetical protein